jgi:hypothetical protein
MKVLMNVRISGKYSYFAKKYLSFAAMLILADKKIPGEAAANLASHGVVHLFETGGITYGAVSGHPDVFFCRVNGSLVAAPNVPEHTRKILRENGVPFVEGETPVGAKYPATARYNAVSTDRYLLHNFRYTDPVITRLGEDLDLVHLSQGYARCNLLPLSNGSFITSDGGIAKVLTNFKIPVLRVNPDGILLPGFSHGFIGGAAGMLADTVFFIGSLDHYADGAAVRNFLESNGHRHVELYDGPLFDGGSLMFL